MVGRVVGRVVGNVWGEGRGNVGGGRHGASVILGWHIDKRAVGSDTCSG